MNNIFDVGFQPQPINSQDVENAYFTAASGRGLVNSVHGQIAQHAQNLVAQAEGKANSVAQAILTPVLSTVAGAHSLAVGLTDKVANAAMRDTEAARFYAQTIHQGRRGVPKMQVQKPSKGTRRQPPVQPAAQPVEALFQPSNWDAQGFSHPLDEPAGPSPAGMEFTPQSDGALRPYILPDGVSCGTDPAYLDTLPPEIQAQCRAAQLTENPTVPPMAPESTEQGQGSTLPIQPANPPLGVIKPVGAPELTQGKIRVGPPLGPEVAPEQNQGQEFPISENFPTDQPEFGPSGTQFPSTPPTGSAFPVPSPRPSTVPLPNRPRPNAPHAPTPTSNKPPVRVRTSGTQPLELPEQTTETTGEIETPEGTEPVKVTVHLSPTIQVTVPCPEDCAPTGTETAQVDAEEGLGTTYTTGLFDATKGLDAFMAPGSCANVPSVFFQIPHPPEDFQLGTNECYSGIDGLFDSAMHYLAKFVKDTCANDSAGVLRALESLAQSVSTVPVVGGALCTGFRGFAASIRTGACSLDSIADWVTKLTGCDGYGLGASTGIALLLGVVDRWVATVPDSVKEVFHRYFATICPTGVPSLGEAIDLYNRGFISEQAVLCISRLQGQRLDYTQKAMKAAENRPNESDLLLLRRLGEIGDDNGITPKEFSEGMHRLGWANPAERMRWENAQKWIPDVDDAINWMLKDVEDKAVSSHFGLFDEFKEKSTGDVSKVFTLRGMDPQWAEKVWAAHWRNIAPHQLYEMMHRLRPEASERVAASMPPMSFGRDPETGKPLPDRQPTAADVATQPDDVSLALGQADFPPYWRARLMAVAYQQLLRTDLRRAFNLGDISNADIESHIQDLGYSKSDAHILANFWRSDRLQSFLRRPLTKKFIEGLITEKDFRAEMESLGYREEFWTAIKDHLDRLRHMDTTQKCVKSLHADFMKGHATRKTAREAMQKIGYDTSEIDNILSAWQCERSYKRKLPTLSSLHKFAESGLIGPKELIDRVQDLGYTRGDAIRLVTTMGKRGKGINLDGITFPEPRKRYRPPDPLEQPPKVVPKGTMEPGNGEDDTGGSED